MLAATALSANRHESAEAIVEREWPRDAEALRYTRAAVSPTSTATTALSPTRLGNILLDLSPQSAAARLFARCVQVDFTGVQQVNFPYPTLVPTAIFIAEGAPMPMADATLGIATVGPVKKILLGAAVTGELADYSVGMAATIIGRVLSNQVARNLDSYVFDAVAADSTRPAGLLNGVTPITGTAAGSDSYAALIKDLGNMAGAIADAGGAADNIVFIVSAEKVPALQVLAGPSFADRIFGNASLAVGTIIGLDPNGIATGYGGLPQVETSKEATAHFEETTPLPIATGAQGSGVLATPVRSAWQTNTELIRVRMKAAWAALYPGAVQVINSVNW